MPVRCSVICCSNRYALTSGGGVNLPPNDDVRMSPTFFVGRNSLAVRTRVSETNGTASMRKFVNRCSATIRAGVLQVLVTPHDDCADATESARISRSAFRSCGRSETRCLPVPAIAQCNSSDFPDTGNSTAAGRACAASSSRMCVPFSNSSHIHRAHSCSGKSGNPVSRLSVQCCGTISSSYAV